MKRKLKNFFPKPVWAVIHRFWALLHGRYPLWLAQVVLKLRARKARTLSEKIAYKLVHDRDPRLTLFADKFAVRDYVAERVGPEYLTELYGNFPTCPAQRMANLPRNFVAKVNHGSGGVIVVWEGAAPGSALPTNLKYLEWDKYVVHPDALDWNALANLLNGWVSMNYFWNPGRFPEWAYKNIVPSVLFEEFLLGVNGGIPDDLKLFMFGGECGFIQLDVGRFEDHSRNLYDADWNILEGTYAHANASKTFPRPHNLEELLQVASSLSTGNEFVRVDLYQTSRGVVFGELTNYPGSGTEKFKPKELDARFGALWKQNK